MYKWQSLTMGNIVENFGEVVLQVMENFFKYHVVDIRWRYNRKGF